MSKNMTRAALAAAASMAVVSAASHAAASTVLISAAHLATTDYTVTLAGMVDGAAFAPLDVYESPEVLTAAFDGGTPQTLLAFCVDIFHRFDDGAVPLTYETAAVDADSDSVESHGGQALSNVLSGELGYLAALGTTTADPARLAAIQGAIWETEYAGLTVSGGSSYLAYYEGLASSWGLSRSAGAGFAQGIFPLDAVTGGFGTTQGFMAVGVPEPASWALLIMGFGLAGGMLRRRGVPTPARV
jgi:PEP-CTERM motif-containing protein